MRLILRFIFAAALMLPVSVFAATVSVFPASVALNTGDSVTFYVQIQSDHSINTIGAAVLLPPGLTFLSASDGKVLAQWIERPTYNAKNKIITFSGIVPDGWQGTDTIVSIKVAALSKGTYALSFDPTQTEVYKNDGLATPEPVVYGAIRANWFTPPFFYGLLLALVAVALLVKIISRRITIRLV